MFEYRLEHVSREISHEERAKEQRVLSEVAHCGVVMWLVSEPDSIPESGSETMMWYDPFMHACLAHLE